MAERLDRACRAALDGGVPGLPDGYAALDAGLTRGERRDTSCRLALLVLEEFAARLPAGHVLSFVEAAGLIRWMRGDGAALAQLAAAGLRPGARCPSDAPRASGPGDAAPERRTLELVGPATRDQALWSCSAAAVSAPGGEPFGIAHVAARTALGEHVAATAVARAVEERLRAARSVRDHVIAFALRSAAPGDALVAVDADGGVVDANSAGRRWLGPDGGRIKEHLVAGLQAAERGGLDADTDLSPSGPGAVGPRLIATPVRYEQVLLGAVVRVVGGGAHRAVVARAAGAPTAALAARYASEQILGASRGVRAALDLARTAARNDLPVVLQGESGTGKELFAQAIHSLGARAEGPFVAVNCGSIPPSLLEAELFGYEPGTFTGGRREGNAGKFEKASGGTIFLDEIGELPSPAQAALLRVLQEREVVRLGGSSPRPLDIRVVAATNRSLADDVRNRRFRADLYFRLHVLPIEIPPLRERREDVPLLATTFLRDAEGEIGRSGLSFGEAALATLAAYPWPGNVRELRNVVLRTAATAPGPIIEAGDLPEDVRGDVQPLSLAPAPSPSWGQVPESALDREELLRALEASGWNVTRTAVSLQVSRMTLYRWLRKHGIAR
jgi:transcriptional regulator with PAS, ATPase and Fis domain